MKFNGQKSALIARVRERFADINFCQVTWSWYFKFGTAHLKNNVLFVVLYCSYVLVLTVCVCLKSFTVITAQLKK